MERDQAELNELFAVSLITDKVAFHTDIGFEVGIKELVIMDEGDEYLYNNPRETFDWLSGKECILLTATVSGGQDQQMELNLMEIFNIRIFDHSKGLYKPNEIQWNPI